MDQWTQQQWWFCSGSNGGGYPFVLTPSISSSVDGIEPSSTMSDFHSMGAYFNIPFYAYTTTGAGFSSFYMTLTLPSGPDPTQNEKPILGIFRSDGTVTTYNNPEVDQTISISDADPALTMEIRKVGGYPNYTLTYQFPELGGSCPSGYKSTS